MDFFLGVQLHFTINQLTKQFEIDPDQAETVKMIFDLYDSGMGETLVAKELTRLGRKNGVGKAQIASASWTPAR